MREEAGSLDLGGLLREDSDELPSDDFPLALWIGHPLEPAQETLGSIDRNHLQVDGPTEDIMSIDPLDEKWAAFGWRVVTLDGHDIGALVDAFAQRARDADGQPWVFLCDTVKGKGVSFMENVTEWHSHTIDAEQREVAMRELEEQLQAPPL